MASKASLIAPCGMNCGICHAYLRNKNTCPGCRGDDTNKSASCLNCIIKNCEVFKPGSAKFCFECENYPCKRLKQLDKRYRTRYRMSMLENLESIKENGLSAFTENENERWRCKQCGNIICVHKGRCLQCETTRD
jgi:hypothetical protein